MYMQSSLHSVWTPLFTFFLASLPQGLNKRDASVFDLYALDLTTLTLTLCPLLPPSPFPALFPCRA
jgi:hypothetical protein